MGQRIVFERGKNLLLIEVSLRCKNHPTGRITKRKRLAGVEVNSSKAKTIEKQLLAEAQKEKAERDILGVTWEKLLNLYEIHEFPRVLSGDHPQSRQTFQEAVSALRRWTPEWSDRVASQITPADVTRLFHKLKAAELSDSALGKIRGDIKKLFEFGIIHRHISGTDRSPTIGVTIKSRKRMRTEILSEDEIRKLLQYGREYEPAWYYIWAFAIYTGARNGELYALKWTDIDDEQQIITIQRSYNKALNEYKGTKTDEWRKVSICQPLQGIIAELREVRSHDLARGLAKYPEYVLPRPGLWQNGEQARVLRLFCQEIGITPICFHTLRACFATELLKRGVAVPRVMRVGGWKSVKTMMHYVRLAGIDDRGITDPLDFRLGAPDPKAEGAILMEAVGQKFGGTGRSTAEIIPLATRRHPGYAK